MGRGDGEGGKGGGMGCVENSCGGDGIGGRLTMGTISVWIVAGMGMRFR